MPQLLAKRQDCILSNGLDWRTFCGLPLPLSARRARRSLMRILTHAGRAMSETRYRLAQARQ